MAELELTIKGQVESLHLEPGDSILVTLERATRPEIMRHIQQQVEDAFPGHKVVMLTAGLSLSRIEAGS